MSRFFTFLQTYRSGVLFLLFSLACIAFLVQWFAWIFGWGRFSPYAPFVKTGSGSRSSGSGSGGSGSRGSGSGGSGSGGSGSGGSGSGFGTGSGYTYAYGSTKADLRYIFSEAAVKIINDFRHLLALIVVLIFAFALGYSVIKAASVMTNEKTPTMVDNMKNALQAVVATLGGLVGSIIGYYFGESSVVKAAEPGQQPVVTPPPDKREIIPAPGPPKKTETTKESAEKTETAAQATEKGQSAPSSTEKVESAPSSTETVEPGPASTESPDS